jgi:hypothetical protein
MKHETIVAPEVAAGEFDDIVEAFDLLVEPEAMDAEDRTAFDNLRRRLTRAIVRGWVTVDTDAPSVTFTPQRSKRTDPLVFRERTGAALMAMDGKKKNSEMAKTYAIMGNMCGVNPAVFASLTGEDGKVAECIFRLLME